MATTKTAITLESDRVREVDRWVRAGRFPNRGRAIQTALSEMLERRKRQRLMEEVVKINPKHERALAEESFSGELAWPDYGR